MLNSQSIIGVTSRTFSRTNHLRGELEKVFKNVKYNDDGIHFDDDALVSFLSDCEAAIVSGERLHAAVIDRLPNLKVVSKFGVGLDGIALEYLEEKNIKMCWKPGINANSVAELALSCLILMLREAYQLNRDLIEGNWGKVKNSRELCETTIGVMGYGEIGKRLVEFLEHHEANVIVYDPFVGDNPSNNIKMVDLETLLIESDAVTLHLPLTPVTKCIIGYDELKMMKEGAILINLSRGGIVDEDALLRSLNEKHLGAAAFDVFEHEPMTKSGLLKLSNFFSTPHIAGTSKKASRELGLSAINGLIENIDI